MARSVLYAVMLAILLVTAGCLGNGVAAQEDRNANGTRTIDVSATGTASADPDLAIVSVAVEARADSADAAREQVATDVERMREALREFGIADEAVRTTSFHVGPEYDYREGGRELIGYRAYHAFEIESEVEDAGDLVDVTIGNGASQVQGIQFTLSDETRSELREEALSEAVTNGRADADAIATTAGVSIGLLHSASTDNVGFPRPVPMAAEAASDGASRTVVEPGPVEVTAVVSLSYEIR